MKTKLFTENRMLGGYSVAVISDWGYRIRREHLTEEQREDYIKTFGNEIINVRKFNDWWFKANKAKS